MEKDKGSASFSMKMEGHTKVNGKKDKLMGMENSTTSQIDLLMKDTGKRDNFLERVKYLMKALMKSEVTSIIMISPILEHFGQATKVISRMTRKMGKEH